jgi:predicted dehydrogenase
MNTRNLTQPRELASGPADGRAAPRTDIVRAPEARVVEVARRALGRPRNVCLVGAGNIAATHARVLQRMRDVRVAAVVDPDVAAARRLIDSLGAGEVHDTVASALRAGLQLDAAHVMVPPHIHRDAALPLLEVGCSVLLEKPLGVSREECHELLEAARKSRATLGVNQNFVFHPAFVRLRRALAEGTYG